MVKMTGERLAELLYNITHTWSANAAEEIRAHIIALEAERESMRVEAHGAMTALLELVKVLTDDRNESAMDAARRVVAERNHNAESLTLTARECDSLLKRVKALEADLDHSRKTSGKALVEARERAAAADRAVEVWRAECREAESRLAAIRQRAGDEQALLGEYDASANVRVGLRAVARYILGPDAAAPSKTAPECPGARCPMCSGETCKTCGPGMWRTSDERLPASVGQDPCEHGAVERHHAAPSRSHSCAAYGTHHVSDGPCECPCLDCVAYHESLHAPSEMDGLEGEMAERPPLKHDGPCQPLAEPSTAEAFATVRRGWQVMEALEVPAVHSGDEESGQHDEDCALCAHEALLAWSQDAAHTLSLLERRMGQMELAARAVLSSGAWASGFDALQAALTGAPPVFTLEEVVAAASPYIPPRYRADYQHALEALRKNTQKEKSCSKPLPSS